MPIDTAITVVSIDQYRPCRRGPLLLVHAISASAAETGNIVNSYLYTVSQKSESRSSTKWRSILHLLT